ncbi:hypothetical protein KC315_g11721 [Hortaea werneckii]|nr:hypothetical protein KC315_g11721 [Hortaea werneckii]
MATQLSLPVLKYSHALGVRPDNTPPWSHILGDNLYVIVKGADTKTDDGRLQPDGKLNMTIMEGNRLLESVDVASLVDEALAARRGAERVGVMPAVEQLPIFGITREALLALRYKSRSGEARRIQLRLKSASDCRQIVSAFERRGMEFQEQRPQTSRPTTARPPTAGAASDRPFTGHSSSPYFEPVKSPPKRDIFTSQTVESGSLSQSPKRSAQEAFGESGSQAMTHPHFFSRDEMIAPREISPERPPTSFIYRSNTTPFQHSQYGMTLPQQQSYERPSSSSKIATVEAVRGAVEEDTAHSRPTTGKQQEYANESWRPAVSQVDRSALGSPSNNGTRPSTGLLPTNVCTVPPPDSQEFALPPKRDLPFKRPDSRRESDRTNSRPNSSALTMPPLPKPKLVKENQDTSSRKESMAQVEEQTQIRTLASTPKGASGVIQNAGILRPKTFAAEHFSGQPSWGREQQAKITYTPTPGLTADRAVNGTKQPHYQPLAEGSPNKVSRVSSLVDAPHEIDDSPPRPLSPPKTLYQASDPQDPSDNVAASLRALGRCDPHEVTVEEYATQSREERQAALETFMLANLENPAFAKLCEDVENCWRRIALGL